MIYRYCVIPKAFAFSSPGVEQPATDDAKDALNPFDDPRLRAIYQETNIGEMLPARTRAYSLDMSHTADVAVWVQLQH